MTRICAQCYACLKWGGASCDGGILRVIAGNCPGHDPIPEPEPCEAETRPMFEEV